MKKKNKLVLDRETITSLQSDTLDGVAGGVAQSGCIQLPSRLTGDIPISTQITSRSGASQVSRQVSQQLSQQLSRQLSGFMR